MEYEQFSKIYNALKSASADSSLNQDNVIKAVKDKLSQDSDEYKEWEFSLDHVFTIESDFGVPIEDTLLIRACESADLKVVDFLLKAGASVNVAAGNKNPFTVAIENEWEGSKEDAKAIVDFLIGKVDAHVGAADKNVNNTMVKAVERGNLRVFEALKEAGASLDTEAPGGTLLKWAESHQPDPVIKKEDMEKIIGILDAHEKKKQTASEMAANANSKQEDKVENTTLTASIPETSSETSPDNVVSDNSSEGAEQGNVDIQAAQGVTVDKKKEFRERLEKAIQSSNFAEVKEVFKNKDSNDIQQQVLTFNESALDYNPLRYAAYLASNTAKDKKTPQEVGSLQQIFSLLWDKCSERTKAGYSKMDAISYFTTCQAEIKKENYNTQLFDSVIEKMTSCRAANAQNATEGDVRVNPVENEGDLDEPEQTSETSSETLPDNVVLNNSSKDAEQDNLESTASTSSNDVNPVEDKVSQKERDEEYALKCQIEEIALLDGGQFPENNGTSLPDDEKEDNVGATATSVNGGNTSPAPTTGNKTPEKSLPDDEKEDTIGATTVTSTNDNKAPEKNDTNFWSEHKGKIALGGAGLCVAGAIAAYVLAYPAVALALTVLAAVILMGAIAKVLEDPSVENPFTQREVH